MLASREFKSRIGRCRSRLQGHIRSLISWNLLVLRVFILLYNKVYKVLIIHITRNTCTKITFGFISISFSSSREFQSTIGKCRNRLSGQLWGSKEWNWLGLQVLFLSYNKVNRVLNMFTRINKCTYKNKGFIRAVHSLWRLF